MGQSVLALNEVSSELSGEARGLAHPRKKGIKGRTSRLLDGQLTPSLADPSRVIFLDVETTGLSWFYDELTLVGWACNGAYKVCLRGDDPQPLIRALSSAQTLVTFNGTLFDLKFIRKSFGEIALPPLHIDLRYLSRRVGLVGGQKSIERELGISARTGVEKIDGAAAVMLWHAYSRGDVQALQTLIDYNRRDVLAMCGILDSVLDRLDIHPDLLLSYPRFAETASISLSAPLAAIAPERRNLERPLHSFEKLFKGTAAERAKIVGIDLTGSERRASGFCLLEGSNAETSLVHSDQEMIDRVMLARPHLVSIDSPLSLPFGRTSVRDDDTGRVEFGIMRKSERELKRRGINVYPCLLPSMQALTQRGMLLADRLRLAGIPVIESYPGAAQDIMGIPRKGASEKYLKQGLSEFGIHGSFEENDVSHDELDAITSAVVGSFFLSGRFEALRGPSEGALIIPDLKSDGPVGMVVGISGRISAGKTSTARFLEKRGFAYTRYSLVIDDEITARGEIPNRASRQRVGNEIHKTRGQRWLSEKALERVDGQEFIVIDGLRFPEDHTYLLERYGPKFVHLHIAANTQTRATRYYKIEGGGLPFEVVDRQPVESNIDDLSRLASNTIENDSSIEELERLVIEYVETLKHGHLCKCRSQ
ncbi:ribonuclease H-like domain-containing protein [Bradyrhizobium sediminis]|uniref:Ribonuclease H-like domain-containing protein n=1 Tax=Bradyrhizobium sediminis TaxID=2840469 RepID=A0A975RMA3_9BRAD|nr:ribonuclease H-like domain-containing protein [Bradyrhizobium sediminis]QWG13407.1 ribonuclease H-like domain-containing protein [Bradyrhizobium sediminis]